MRTLTPWMLTALLVLAVAGCGGEDAADSEGDGQSATPNESPAANDSPGDEQPATDSDSGDDGGSSGDSAAGDGDADVQATIEVRDGQVRGGAKRVQADVGDTVALTVTSDVADTVHVHGYDLEEPVAPEEPTTVAFTVDIPGVFEVELHDSGLKLADLQVGG